jgi:UDP:flavonoid glycosyltransferase YjiC (YdhE family)
MKLGFICPQAPGHLNPITALARQLQARFLTSEICDSRDFRNEKNRSHHQAV